MAEEKASVGMILRLMRQMREMTLREVEDKVGIHRNTLQTWETSRYVPPVDAVETLVGFYMGSPVVMPAPDMGGVSKDALLDQIRTARQYISSVKDPEAKQQITAVAFDMLAKTIEES